jgi:hypothetical protein
MLLLPTGLGSNDHARYWQMQNYGGHEEAYELMDNIFLYAIDKGTKGGLRKKGETYIVDIDRTITPIATIKVARLQYTGNWNPEPGGWRRLAAVLHNQKKIDLDVKTVPLGEGKLDKTFKLAHLTGTSALHLADGARSELKKFIEDGGALVMDAAGGDAAFGQSIEAEAAAILPQGSLGIVPAGHPVFAGPMATGEIEYRRFARKLVGSARSPRLRGIDVKGRTALWISAEDLSVGMVGQQVDGIFGYSPQTATALMGNIAVNADPGAIAAIKASTRPATRPSTLPATRAATKPTTQR